MQSKTMQMTEEIMERILHLYESVMVRHGGMVVGSTMTGKTTSIQLLQECLNRSRENELEERIHEFNVKKAKKIAIQTLTKSNGKTMITITMRRGL
jgi:type IV secretory pathway ATPase VirB11/archaellum biosynthesis ATPase